MYLVEVPYIYSWGAFAASRNFNVISAGAFLDTDRRVNLMYRARSASGSNSTCWAPGAMLLLGVPVAFAVAGVGGIGPDAGVLAGSGGLTGGGGGGAASSASGCGVSPEDRMTAGAGVAGWPQQGEARSQVLQLMEALEALAGAGC